MTQVLMSDPNLDQVFIVMIRSAGTHLLYTCIIIIIVTGIILSKLIIIVTIKSPQQVPELLPCPHQSPLHR